MGKAEVQPTVKTDAETFYADSSETTEVTENQTPETPAVTEEKKEAAATTTETAETKPEGEETNAEEKKVEDKLELKLPDGSTLDQGYVEKIASFAKEQGLSKEQAQAILDRDSKQATESAQNQAAQLKTKVNAWVEDLKNDPNIGGDNFSKSAQLAKNAMEHFGSPELNKLLSDTGLGNHPELFKAFLKIGKEMANDEMIQGGTQVTKEKSIEDIFYPQTKGN